MLIFKLLGFSLIYRYKQSVTTLVGNPKGPIELGNPNTCAKVLFIFIYSDYRNSLPRDWSFLNNRVWLSTKMFFIYLFPQIEKKTQFLTITNIFTISDRVDIRSVRFFSSLSTVLATIIITSLKTSPSVKSFFFFTKKRVALNEASVAFRDFFAGLLKKDCYLSKVAFSSRGFYCPYSAFQ